MSDETLTKKLMTAWDKEGLRLYQQESAIEELGELICRLMKAHDVSREDLATCLAKTETFGSSNRKFAHLALGGFLEGSRDIYIREMADIFTALGYELEFGAKRLPERK